MNWINHLSLMRLAQAKLLERLAEETFHMSTKETDTVEYIWHSPLLQAVATLRASAQCYCADACQELFALLHKHNPNERSEVKIVQQLIDAAGDAVDRDDPTCSRVSHHCDTTISDLCPDRATGCRHADPYAYPCTYADADAGGGRGTTRDRAVPTGAATEVQPCRMKESVSSVERPDSLGIPTLPKTGAPTSSGSAATASSGQPRRHCNQAAPLGGGVRLPLSGGSSERWILTGRKLRCFDSYGRSIVIPETKRSCLSGWRKTLSEIKTDSTKPYDSDR